MPREARVTSESERYHIMLRGINKQNIFESDEDKNIYQSYPNTKKNVDLKYMVFV